MTPSAASEGAEEDGGQAGAPAFLVPDGCRLLPERLTAENGAKAALIGEFCEFTDIECPECGFDDEAVDDCPVCGGSGTVKQTVPVGWRTIKAIWARGVDHFAAAAPPPRLEPSPEVRELLNALSGLLAIAGDSRGVSGYHQNGEVAEWDEFEEVAAAQALIDKWRKV